MLKRLLTTAGAVARGVVNTLMAEPGTVVELGVGDRAPDFTLPGSDGQIYRLSALSGAPAVVVAWFPKAFTGG